MRAQLGWLFFLLLKKLRSSHSGSSHPADLKAMGKANACLTDH
jgi:hypothetical protein